MASARGSRDPVVANPTTGTGLAPAAARESFFNARERHRRAAALYGALAAAAVGVTGLPLGIAVTPLLYLMILPVATALSVAYPKALLWGAIRYLVPFLIPYIALMAFSRFDYVVHEDASNKGVHEFHAEAHHDFHREYHFGDSAHQPPGAADTESHSTARTGEPPGAAPSPASDVFGNDPIVQRGTMPGLVPALALVAILLVLPGSLVLLVTWGLVRRVFRRSGVGGVLLALGARVPDSTDLAEQRLVDVVGEMAVAAGLPPPRVMIIGLACGTIRSNAAAIGWSVNEATIVVTRPLLDTLSRDELQAVVGRLVASIGNGDLRLAFLILSAFETIGLVRLAIHGTYRSDARRTLGRFVRLGLRRSRPDGSGGSDDPEAQAVQALLARGAGTPLPHEAGRFLRAAGRVATFLLTPLRIPLRMVAFTIRSVVTLSAILFAGPVLGALWRRREMLADATAVQLTRNADALAGALVNLTRAGAAVPGADALAHLFVVWPTDRRVPRSLEASPDSLAAARRMIVRLEVRIAALKAMGARVNGSSDQDRALARHAALAHSAATAALFTVALPGAALAVALILAIDLVLMSLTLGAAGALMGALTHLLLPASGP